MWSGGLALFMGLFLNVAEAAPAPALPVDARLESVRGRLETLVARTTEAGLPADLLVSKVREGLAKGVPAERIEQATVRLADSLEASRRFVAERRAAPSPELVRAVAEARIAGIGLAETDALVRGERPSAEAARAVEVLTDLTLRGYPAGRSSSVVKEVLVHDPGAIARLPAALETLRVDQALSHVETVDALSRGLAGSDSLQTALSRTVDDERRKGEGRGRQNKGGDDPGKSGFVPPGQLKKQGNPGKGRGPK
jgi:hypothetical protein